jgi:hypothetical protein
VTLVLIKMENGTVCEGVAGVPWPKQWKTAADPARGSFIFSLRASPVRFDLVKPGEALFSGGAFFRFGGLGGDLLVWGDGCGCGSIGQTTYAGPRQDGQLVGGTPGAWKQPYERWELWRL